MAVIGPDGIRADRRDSRIAPDDVGALDVSLGGQAQGTYVVRWRAISADSHPVNGTFEFSVGHPTAAASAEAAAGPAQSSGGVPLQATARWLHLLGLALLVGPLVILSLALKTSDLPAAVPALWRCSRWGAVMLLPATVLSLVAQAAAVAGSLVDGLQPAALLSVLHTRWGLLWSLRAMLVAGVITVTNVAARRLARDRRDGWWRGAALVFSGALIALATMNSHAAATAPVWLSVGVDWVHVAATVVWMGGLFSLAAILLPAARQNGADARNRVLGSIVARFSITALASVEILILTGLYQTWAHVSGPSALASTAYGRTLLIKLGLVAAMLVPAAFNLLVARPRLAHDRDPMPAHDLRRFHRAVAAETGLGLLVLGSVAVLTSLPPAQSVEAASSVPVAGAANEPAVTLAAPAGTSLVTLTLGPGRIGSNRLDIRVRDRLGAVVTDARVRVRIVPPSDSQIAPWAVVPAPTAQGYHATVALAPGGRWGIEVAVTTDLAPAATATFQLTVPLLGAGELLAAAMDRMNGLRTMAEQTEMSMAGVQSREQIEYQAPDRRRTLDQAGEATELQIGGTRYTREDGRWQERDGAAFRWPDYRWLESATDVAMLGREAIDGAECFVVSYVDTRDASRVQVWIATGSLRILRRTSAVPGHFHASRFSRFDGPVHIEAPPVAR